MEQHIIWREIYADLSSPFEDDLLVLIILFKQNLVHSHYGFPLHVQFTSCKLGVAQKRLIL